MHEGHSELKEYQPISPALEPPWERQSSNWKIDLGTKDVAATNEFIRRTNATYTIYTDGSASEGTQDGGSAVVVTTGTQEDTTIVATLKLRGRLLTSSYEEERTAMLAAVQWISTKATPVDSVLICNDSLSLTQAMKNHSADTSGIRQLLNLTGCQTIVR